MARDGKAYPTGSKPEDQPVNKLQLVSFREKRLKIFILVSSTKTPKLRLEGLNY